MPYPCPHCGQCPTCGRGGFNNLLNQSPTLSSQGQTGQGPRCDLSAGSDSGIKSVDSTKDSTINSYK